MIDGLGEGNLKGLVLLAETGSVEVYCEMCMELSFLGVSARAFVYI
jgi:hypothetical protein